MTEEEIAKRDIALAIKAEAMIVEALPAGEDAFASTMAIAEVILARQLLKVDGGRADNLTAASMIARHVYQLVTARDSREALLRSLH